MIINILNGGPAALANAVVAVGALGTAAFGLVDVSKAVRGGGPSSFGFEAILKAARPFQSALVQANGPAWASALRSHWINGMPLDDQKARAKALIHLGLTPDTARQIAAGLDGRIDPARFSDVAHKLQTGDALTPEDINVMGRFDVLLSAALDSGYERADQQYRNRVKLVACGVAVLLAMIAGYLIDCQEQAQLMAKCMGPGAQCGAGLPATPIDAGRILALFIGGPDIWLAIVVGLLSTPLAPIAKDLSSALKAAAEATKASKG